jgi:hypothetical protein
MIVQQDGICALELWKERGRIICFVTISGFLVCITRQWSTSIQEQHAA